MNVANVFAGKPFISNGEVRSALQTAVLQVRRNLPRFTYSCQNHTSVDNFYPPCDNDQWTCGFWPGEIWLAYEFTKDPVFKYAGLIMVQSFLGRIERKIEVDHHDMGFLYSPSCTAAYKLTGDEDARRAAILAADQLLRRFHPVGGFLQAWGELGATDNYRYIIDCLLNLPLLHWAAKETGDTKYSETAQKHIATCIRYSIRENGSTYHTVFMDPQTGAFSRGAACQGYRDDSDWARGQAWAVYGLALNYRYTKKPQYAQAFRRVLEFYLTRLPDDLIPYWDMIFIDGDEPRDSSSASIVVCGLLEMAKHTGADEAGAYTAIARQMLKSLVDNYSVKDPAISNGLCLHATYSKKSPYNTCTPEGVDECASWGDYFYMEALTRLHGDWDTYW
ncbi:MAG: glycoside hydrolase family 88 protein [Oscillospiraceae bacterium]|nr:glycoside hydrolase family 88 protein [Oscillospiraceae bacterium]